MTGRNGTYEYCFSDGSEQFTVCRCEVFLEREELPLKYLCLLMDTQIRYRLANTNINTCIIIYIYGQISAYIYWEGAVGTKYEHTPKYKYERNSFINCCLKVWGMFQGKKS